MQFPKVQFRGFYEVQGHPDQIRANEGTPIQDGFYVPHLSRVWFYSPVDKETMRNTKLAGLPFDHFTSSEIVKDYAETAEEKALANRDAIQSVVERWGRARTKRRFQAAADNLEPNIEP